MAEKVVSKLRGNMWRLIILAVAGSLIYGLPYFRTYYYDAYLQAYNLTNTQMGSLGSIFGVFGMISYLFGGVVADFISPKKLISISLILTGVAGFCHLFATNYSMLLVIYLVWGFTALFAFWPALVKGIRSLASSEEQGKAYGFMEADQRGPSRYRSGHHHRHHQQAWQRRRPQGRHHLLLCRCDCAGHPSAPLL